MKKPTREQMAAQNGRLQSENFCLTLALHDVMNNAVTWSGWYKETDGNAGMYRAGVSRYDSASGALLLVLFRHPGQDDHVAVYDLDNQLGILRKLRDHCPSYQPQIDAIVEARCKAMRKAA